MIGVKIMNLFTPKDYTNYLNLQQKLPFNRKQRKLLKYLFKDVSHNKTLKQ